jgi:hypothetical protein
MGRAGHVAEPVVGMQTERERCIQVPLPVHHRITRRRRRTRTRTPRTLDTVRTPRCTTVPGHVAEPVVGMQTERERCIQRMGEAIRPSPRGTIGIFDSYSPTLLQNPAGSSSLYRISTPPPRFPAFVVGKTFEERSKRSLAM